MAYSNSAKEKKLLKKIYDTGSTEINNVVDELYKAISHHKEVRLTDMLLIQQLGATLYLNKVCLSDVIANGVTTNTVGREGEVIKENPASRNFLATSNQIQKLFKQLGIEPELVVDSMDSQEEDVLGSMLKDIKGK